MSTINKVYCQSCRKYAAFVAKVDGTYFAEHRCCACPNCTGSCCQSDKLIEAASRLPGWHSLHVCGIFCDGQDGAGSWCAKAKQKGPPDAITRLGAIE